MKKEHGTLEIVCHFRECDKVARVKHDTFPLPTCRAHAKEPSARTFIWPAAKAPEKMGAVTPGRERLGSADRSAFYGKRQARWADWRTSGVGLNGPVTVRKIEEAR